MNISLRRPNTSSRHNRTISVDVPSENLSFVNSSHLSNISTLKPSHSKKLISHKHTHSHVLIPPNILDDNLLNSNTNSPTRPSKLNKSARPISQSNSAMNSRRESRLNKYDKLASICMDTESEVDKSLSRAIQITYDKQLEREKDLGGKKENLEKEIAQLKKGVHDLTNKMKMQRDSMNSRQANVSTLLKDVERILNTEL